MSNIHNLVVGLEQKILVLREQMQRLLDENEKLRQEKEQVTAQNFQMTQELDNWQKRYDALKLTNTILGSDDNRTDTKIKINALIREIDDCIKQLSNNQ